jgi:hypothetical protein
MQLKLRRSVAIGTAVAAVAALGGGAYAATQNSTGSRQAFLDDLANRLHVTPTQLQNAVREAYFDRLQAAVAAGRLTQAQANAIKQRIQKYGLRGAGPWLFAGPRGFGGRHLFGPMILGGPDHASAAASFLGLTEAQLLSQLRSGKSLAQIARARGKSVAGLKSAILNEIRSRLNSLVSRGVITSAREQRILSRLSARLDDAINRTGPPPFGPRFHRGIAAPGALPAPPGADGPPLGADGPPPGADGPPPGVDGPPPGLPGPPV